MPEVRSVKITQPDGGEHFPNIIMGLSETTWIQGKEGCTLTQVLERMTHRRTRRLWLRPRPTLRSLTSGERWTGRLMSGVGYVYKCMYCYISCLRELSLCRKTFSRCARAFKWRHHKSRMNREQESTAKIKQHLDKLAMHCSFKSQIIYGPQLTVGNISNFWLIFDSIYLF